MIPTDFQRTWHKDSHPAGMLLHLGPDGSAYMDRCEGCTLIAEIDRLRLALKEISEEACICHLDHGSRCNCDAGGLARLALAETP